MDLIAYAARLPRPGETLIGTRFQTGYGGKGANQAVAAARLGAAVAMIARVGDDVFGADMLRNFSAQGVDARFVATTPEVSSGVAPIAVDAEGRNAIIVVPGANGMLTPADVDAAGEVFAGAKAVLCQLEVPVETTTRALARGREARALTIFNPAPAQTDLPRALFAACDLVCPNETEAALLTGVGVEDEAGAERAGRALLALGARAVVITLGARGCCFVSADACFVVNAPPVRAVDTTGAGDCFLGALAVFLARGVAMRDALGRACAAAALSVTRSGTQTSFPTRQELM